MKVVIGLLQALFAAFVYIGNAGESVRIRPEGHLREFLSRQVTGLTGNRQAMGYPFDGCMWAGSISNVYFEEDLPYGRKVAAPRDEIWWPYEQAAYLLDGMMRLSRHIDTPELRFEVHFNLPDMGPHYCDTWLVDGSIMWKFVPKGLPGPREFYSKDENARFFREAIARGLEIRRATLGVGRLALVDCRQFWEIGSSLAREDPRIVVGDLWRKNEQHT